MSVRISRQHWQALLGELEDAQRQRHLLTYRALIERLAAINALNAEALLRQDAVAYVRTNLEFHRTLYLRAQTPAMLALCETVWLLLPCSTVSFELAPRYLASTLM